MDKVFCPYCGSEMEIEWDDFDFCAYTCPRCNSKAPRGDSIEDAEEKALRRPLQKPLTLPEAYRLAVSRSLHRSR